MEFGMFHEFQWRKGHSEAEAFEESFAQVEAAERWGLDALWLAELHIMTVRLSAFPRCDCCPSH